MTISLSDRIMHRLVLAEAPAGDSPGGGEFSEAMREFYRDVDASIASHQPVCINRGNCCKFASYGHRLYVTDVELDYFLLHEPPRPVAPAAVACPYQEGGRCTAREHRPLGCRIFFCDENSRNWQGPEYERHLERLKQIGQRFGISYRYREWLSALADGSGK
jgi:Fe-S-cluster containining protein